MSDVAIISPGPQGPPQWRPLVGWTANTAYFKPPWGSAVYHDGSLYECRVDHTSGTDFAADLAAERWQIAVSAQLNAEWQAIVDATVAAANAANSTALAAVEATAADAEATYADREQTGLYRTATASDLGLAQAARQAAEAARDASIVNAQTYPDEPTGRAAVANGATYDVQGSGSAAVYRYRRVNGSTPGTLIAAFPSLAAVNAVDAKIDGLSVQLSEGVFIPGFGSAVTRVVVDGNGRAVRFTDASNVEWSYRDGVLNRTLTDKDNAYPEGVFVPGLSTPAVRVALDINGRAMQVIGLDGRTYVVNRNGRWVTPGEPLDFDVVVYGSGQGGLMAMARAALRGKRVCILDPYPIFGGMTANGLTGVDKPSGGVTPETVVGGLTAAYLARIGEIDGYENRHRPQAKTAERVAREWIDKYAAMAVANVQIEGPQAVMRSTRPDGWTQTVGVFTSIGYITCRGFNDASYEFDLGASIMGRSGYRTGRESFAETGEPSAGVQPQGIPTNFGPNQGGGIGFQHYTGSGTVPTLDQIQQLPLPILVDDPMQTTGQADNLVQAPNVRIPMTRLTTNYAPLIKPYGYDHRFFVILAQKIRNDREGRPLDHKSWQVCRGGGSYGYQEFCAGQKVNWNAMDALNIAAGYSEASWAQRKRIAADVVFWQQGAMWFIANDPIARDYGLGPMQDDWNDTTTPDATGAVGPLGLCADEFQFSQFGAGWPHWPYIRETRRPIGKMTLSFFDQIDAGDGGTPTKAHPVCVWAYTHDIHAIQLTRKMNIGAGTVYTDRIREEGTPANVTDHTARYQVPMEALLPHESFKIANLVFSTCISTTHVGWAPQRLEMPEGACGEAAGEILAWLCDNPGRRAEDMPYELLAARLTQYGSILS